MYPVSKLTIVPVGHRYEGMTSISSISSADIEKPHPRPHRGTESSYSGPTWLFRRSGRASRLKVGIMHRARLPSLSVGGSKFGGNSGLGPNARPVLTWSRNFVFWPSNRDALFVPCSIRDSKLSERRSLGTVSSTRMRCGPSTCCRNTFHGRWLPSYEDFGSSHERQLSAEL